MITGKLMARQPRRRKKLPKKEHDIQRTIVDWVRFVAEKTWLDAKWIHSIPNGGKRNAVVGRRLKLEGTKKGLLDLFVPCPRAWFAGLYIEVKQGNRLMTAEQEDFAEYARRHGYLVAEVREVLDAIELLKGYLSLPSPSFVIFPVLRKNHKRRLRLLVTRAQELLQSGQAQVGVELTDETPPVLPPENLPDGYPLDESPTRPA